MKFLCSVSHGYIKFNCSCCWAPGILVICLWGLLCHCEICCIDSIGKWMNVLLQPHHEFQQQLAAKDKRNHSGLCLQVT